MARLVGPDEGSRLVYITRSDKSLAATPLASAVVYADDEATTLADIRTHPEGQPIPGSQLTVDGSSLLPLFQFPDGVDVVYVRVGRNGPVFPVYARATDQASQAMATAAAKVSRGELVYNARDYGAVGDLVADDTVAIQAAVNAAASGHGELFLPKGNYRITAPIVVPSRFTLRGAGPFLSTIRTSTPNINMIEVVGASALSTKVQVFVRDLGLVGPGQNSGSTGCGIFLKWVSASLAFDNLYIQQMGSHGIYQLDSYTISYRDVICADNGGDGWRGETNTNQTLWERTAALRNKGAGYKVIGGAAGLLLNADAESNQGPGIDLRYVFGYTVLCPELEQNGKNGTDPNMLVHWRTDASEKASMVTVSGGVMSGGAITKTALLIDGANQVQVSGVNFGQHTSENIKVTAAASRVQIGMNNYTDGTPLVNASATLGVLEADPVSGLPRTTGITFLPGATPTVPAGGQLWYSDLANRLRHRDTTGSTVRDVCSGVTGTVTATNVTIPAGGTVDVTASLGGASVGQKVITSAPVNLPAGVMPFSFVSGANTVTLRLLNTTGAAITGYTGSFLVQAIF